MDEEWLTTEELLRRVPIRGERPDAILKRLRGAGILERPRGKGRGRGRGRGQLHPPGTEARLRLVVALRRRGVWPLKELRWWLWLEGADDLWPGVRQDLLEAYPIAEQAATAALMREDPEDGLLDKVDLVSGELADEWSRSHDPYFDRRKVRTEGERTDLIATSIESALLPIIPDLTQPLDPEAKDSETRASLLDRAYGEGAADTLQRAMDLGATDPSGWHEALRTADAARARVVARLWVRAFGPKLAEELRFSVGDWTNRSLTMAALLFATEHGLGTPTD